MQFSISITDATQLLALQRAVIAHNGNSMNFGQEVDAGGLLQSIVNKNLADFSERFLVKNLTKLAFLNRFTAEERIGIRAAAQASPAIADYLAMLDAAQDVDLTDARTIGGANALEAAGLIGAGRAVEILAL